MCPDRQLFSVYLDGELPSPWKEKMESHLAGCPHCRGLLDSYRRIFPPNVKAEEAIIEQAKLKVWRKLEEKINGLGQSPSRTEQIPERLYGPRTRFWSRRITLPLPAAAAAVALLIVVCATLWTMRSKERTALPNMTLASEEFSISPSAMYEKQGFDHPGIVPTTNINDVLQYLGNRDSGDILIIRLPESRNFTSSGEPAIIKAADYSRRKP
jgi:Txe/YoeB family toxin of Txe-Axe toxin-antitoxin module